MKEIELIDKRKKCEKHFLQENGEIIARMYEEPIHFLKDGQYEEIHNTLILKDDYYVNQNNSYKVWFGLHPSEDFMQIETLDYYLNIRLKNHGDFSIQKSPNASMLEDRITYQNILEHIDLDYQVLPTKVKESIVLRNRNAKVDTPEFIIKTNMELTIVDDKRICANKDGETIFYMDAPYMYDANDRIHHNVCYHLEKIGQEYRLKLIVDQEWLDHSNTAYPVIIDPTIVGNQNKNSVYDTYIYPGDTGVDRNNREYLKVGVERVNGVDVTNRSLIKFDLPIIGTGSYVTYARMRFIGYPDITHSHEQDFVNVYRVTENWDETTANWNTMNDKFDSSRVEGTFESNRDYLDEPNGVISPFGSVVEITGLVQKWYTGTPNYGVLLKANTEQYRTDVIPMFFSKNNTITGDPKPILEITYRNQNGLEHYMDYNCQSFSQGSTYHNTYNGNLTGIFDIGATIGGQLPASLKLVYNTNDVVLEQNFGYGIGYRFNLYQTIKEEEIDNTKYLAYVDEDGTIHYFLNQKVKFEQNENGSSGFITTSYETTYFDEDGLNLMIEYKDTYYTMKDKNGNEKTFIIDNKIGYLSEIKDVSGNKISISYDSSHRITKVIDANMQEIQVTYRANVITVTTLDQVITLNYLNDNLISIVSIQGTTSFTNHHHLISSITDVTGKKIEYTYYEQSPYKIKKITEYGLHHTVGTFYEVSYGLNATTITDSKNRVKTITYNSYGNPVSMSSLKDHNDITNAYGIQMEYGESFRGVNTYANKLLKNQVTLKYVKNYIKDSSFEKGETDFVGDRNANVVTSVSAAYSGNRGLKIEWGQGMGAYMPVVVPKGHYYTFSAYCKTIFSEIYMVLQYKDKNNEWNFNWSRPFSSEDAFTRHDVTIYYPEDATGDLMVGFAPETYMGVCYIDDIQLEEGQVANSYNMVENSDFSEGLSTWNLRATRHKTGEEISTDSIFQIVQVNEKQSALKVSMNPEVSTTFSKAFDVNGTAGEVYTLSFWYKNEGLEAGEGIYYGTYNNIIFGFIPVVEQQTDAIYNKTFHSNEKEWQYFSYTFTAPWDFKGINMTFLQSQNANNFYITNLNLFRDVRSVTYDYDENGNVILSKNLNHDSSSFKYDQNNQLIQMTNPMGKNFTFEYDNIVTDRILKGVSETGISNETEYDSFGNPIITRIVNRGQVKEIGNGSYQIRLKGTNQCIRLMDSKVSFVNDTCCHDKWVFEKVTSNEKDYYKIKHSVISNQYFTLSNNQLSFTNLNGDYSLFLFTRNENGSFTIQCKANNLYLCYDNNRLYFKELEEGNCHFEFYIEAMNPLEFIENSCEYTEDGKFIKSVTDTRMHTTVYDIDSITGLTKSVTNAKDQTTNYSYNEKRQLIGITTGDRSVGYTYNEQNMLSEITQQDRVYHFIYDNFLNMKSVKIGDNITLITNQYEENNGNLVSSIYGNQDSITYEYDEFDRIKKVNKMNDTYEYFYGNNGDLLKMKSNNHTIHYTYDTGKRLYEYSNNHFKIRYGYDSNDNIICKKYYLNQIEHSIQNTLNDDDSIINSLLDDCLVCYSYDYLGRLKERTIGDCSTEYQYITNGKRTSLLMQSIKIDDEVYSYKYDKLDNITHIYHNNTLENRYYYDAYNELVKEDSYVINKTIVYEYDKLGNILSKKVYELGTDNLLVQDTYEYHNSSWKDQLTKYNDDVITYDEIGNPLTIGDGITLDWINGRQLNRYTDSNHTIEYEYNKDGIRTSKTVNNVKTEYYVEGTSIIFEKTGNDVIYYIRNDVDGLIGLQYHDANYYYMKNNQNDIIGILDSSYHVVAKYTYDAWGNMISITDGNGIDVSNDTTHIANINPFRYRSYYYDSEINLYYLNSRYYNPTYGRFINSDNYVSTDTGILGYNMYAYCNNNFINYSDVSGNGFFVALGIIAVGVAVVSYVNTEYRSRKAQKEIAKVQQKPNVPDKTKEIDAELKKNATQIVNDTQAQLTPHKLYTFINDTKSGSKYDLKQKEEWKGQTVSYRGMVLEPQDIGNLNFGYIGRAMGYNVDFLTLGAGAYQLATNYKNPETYLNCFSATFCDDPRDTYYIRMGAIIYDSQN